MDNNNGHIQKEIPFINLSFCGIHVKFLGTAFVLQLSQAEIRMGF